MSTNVKEGLFDLIKSLSKSEKRYFKLISSRHTIGEENNYVRLFDFIDKQVVYNEKQLFKEFNGEAFLHRFSITKKRLYDHVLNALDAFYSSSSIDSQLFKLIHSADILYKKSLYDQCGRLLRSAEKLADKHEKYLILSEIRRKQKKLIENNAYSGSSISELLEIEVRDKSILSKVDLYNTLWTLKSKMFLTLSRKGKARSEDDRIEYRNIIEQLPKDLKTDELSFDAAYLYNHIQSAFYFATDDMEKTYIFLRANLKIFENREDAMDLNLNTYFSLLTNTIYVSEQLGYHQDSTAFLKVLKSIPSRFDISSNEDLQIKLFASSISIELSLLTHRGEYHQAHSLFPIIESGLREFGNKISPVRKAFILFKLATIQLGLGNFSGALKWINLILNDTELDGNEDILSYTQILDLLVHLEMEHNQLLPYSLKNTQRFLKSRNRLYSFERVFLQFVSKRIKCKNQIDAQILWEELYYELSQIQEDSFEGIALEYFDFIAWAEFKFKKISFTEILKQKFNKKYKKSL